MLVTIAKFYVTFKLIESVQKEVRKARSPKVINFREFMYLGR
jgi:hypothetical protein